MCALIVAVKERFNVGKNMQVLLYIVFLDLMPGLVKSAFPLLDDAFRYKDRTSCSRSCHALRHRFIFGSDKRLHRIIGLTEATRWTHVTNLQNHSISYLSTPRTPQS